MKWALRSRTQSRIASARSLSWSTWPSAASGLLVAQDLARGVKPPGTGAPGLTASGAAHRGAQAHGSPATREAAHWDLLKVTRVMLSHAEAALETLRALRSRALRPRQPARRRSSRAS